MSQQLRNEIRSNLRAISPKIEKNETTDEILSLMMAIVDEKDSELNTLRGEIAALSQQVALFPHKTNQAS